MGRKKLADMGKIYVYLPKAIVAQVWALAEQKQQPMSTLVRAMIEETLLAREEKRQ